MAKKTWEEIEKEFRNNYYGDMGNKLGIGACLRHVIESYAEAVEVEKMEVKGDAAIEVAANIYNAGLDKVASLKAEFWRKK